MVVHDDQLLLYQYMFHTSPRGQVFGLSAIKTQAYQQPSHFLYVCGDVNMSFPFSILGLIIRPIPFGAKMTEVCC
jgi:hypothetical protein